MATKKPAQKPEKPVTKAKAAPKKAPERVLVSKKTIVKAPAEKQFAMPMEVKDWIDRANSTINHLRGQVERLTAENHELKSYRKWAEQRILRSEAE